jgi:cell division cycle 2-like protein
LEERDIKRKGHGEKETRKERVIKKKETSREKEKR